MTQSERMIALIIRTSERETLRKLTFSKPDGGEVLRITARLSLGRGRKILACEETRPAGKVRHFAYPLSELADALPPLFRQFAQVNLSSGAGDAEWKRNADCREKLTGAAPIEAKLSGDPTPLETYLTDLNRKKDYLLTGSEPFLIHLGISDAGGRVHDKKQAKYRQINRFLEHIREILPALPGEGELYVLDLCCGKSYLSFAAYYYLHVICGREVDMFCKDLKEDVIRYCASVAAAVGFTGMRFEAGDIRETPIRRAPDLVISLHACDIATDLVLDTAVRAGAGVILSTPCCHRYLNDRVKMPALSFVTEHPYLRGKLCEVLTEGIRLARLRAAGYRVAALEMTDPDDTPKNTLLRAIRRRDFDPDSAEAARLRAEYRAVLELVVGEGADRYLEEIRT